MFISINLQNNEMENRYDIGQVKVSNQFCELISIFYGILTF